MKQNFYSLITSFAEVKEWQIVTVQIMRTGKRNHPAYWQFSVTPETLREVVKNFQEDTRGIELAVDENHEGNHIALWWIRELYIEGDDKCFAKIELTQLWAEKLGRGEYKYFSPDIVRSHKDNETGEQISNLLIWWAFTNRPYFKGMQSLKFNEDVSTNDEDISFYLFNEENPMKEKLLKLLQWLLSAKDLDKAQLTEAEKLYADEKGADDAEIAELYGKVQEKAKQFSEDEGSDDDGNADEGADKATDTEDKETPADKSQEWNVQFTDPKTGEVQSMSFAELKDLQDKVASFQFAEKKKTVSDKISSFVFSEDNKIGLALPKHQDKIVDFAMSLNDEQLKSFSEIIQNLTTEASSLFDENGSDTSAEYSDLTRDEKVDKKAKELVENKTFAEYKDAVLKANSMFNEDGEAIDETDED